MYWAKILMDNDNKLTSVIYCYFYKCYVDSPPPPFTKSISVFSIMPKIIRAINDVMYSFIMFNICCDEGKV